MYGKNVGSLQVGSTKSSGKLVDEWHFASPFRGAKAPELKVRVSIDKSTAREGITFVARGKCLVKDIKHTDIEVLRQEVEAALRFQHDMLTGVPWEDWLEVKVRGSKKEGSFYKEVESSLHVVFEPIKRGVDPATGKAYVVNCNGIAVDFPEPKSAGVEDKLDEWQSGRRETDTEYTYLPATAENLAALHDIANRMQALRASLAAFLSQDNAASSLSNLGANLAKMLPSPDAR